MWKHQNDFERDSSNELDPTYQAFLRQAGGADALHLHNWSQTHISQTPRPISHGFRFPWNNLDTNTEPEQDWQPAAKTQSHDRLLNIVSNHECTPSYLPTEELNNHGRKGSLQELQFNPYTATLLFFTLGFGTLTGVYASGSAHRMLNAHFFSSSPSNSLLTLRILSEVSTILLWGLYLGVLEELQWSLASRKCGMNVLQFVALDMGTGFWGLLRLIFRLPKQYKLSAFVRVLLLISVPIPGILIMSDISINELFFPVFKQNVSAGLDVYNASLSSNLSTKWATALCVSVGNPIWNSRNSISVPPLQPGQGGCVSPTTKTPEKILCEEAYFMGGGIDMVSPQLNESAGYSKATVITVPRTQGYQVEFGVVRDLQSLRQRAFCDVRGDESGAVYWCFSQAESGEFLMGGVYCPLQIQEAHGCINDTSWTQKLTLSTSIFIYRRSATIYYHRSNFTILSVSNLSLPVRLNFSAFDIIRGLNAVSVSANNCSAISHYAATILPASDNQNAALLAIRETRAVFGLVLHYFHANFVGAEDSVWILDTPRPGLSDNMYTTASFAKPAYQATASRRSLWLFVGFQSGLTLLCIISMVQSRRNIRDWPLRTGYPSLDFATNCLPRGGLAGKLSEMRLRPSRGLPIALDYMRVWAGFRPAVVPRQEEAGL